MVPVPGRAGDATAERRVPGPAGSGAGADRSRLSLRLAVLDGDHEGARVRAERGGLPRRKRDLVGEEPIEVVVTDRVERVQDVRARHLGARVRQRLPQDLETAPGEAGSAFPPVVVL